MDPLPFNPPEATDNKVDYGLLCLTAAWEQMKSGDYFDAYVMFGRAQEMIMAGEWSTSANEAYLKVIAQATFGELLVTILVVSEREKQERAVHSIARRLMGGSGQLASRNASQLVRLDIFSASQMWLIKRCAGMNRWNRRRIIRKTRRFIKEYSRFDA